MNYLTVKEVAELKSCSTQHIKKLAKDGKIKAEIKFDPEIKQERYFIPIKTLPEDLQVKYYRQKRTETGLLPEKIEPESTPQTAFKYRLKGVSKMFEEFSEAERTVIKF